MEVLWAAAPRSLACREVVAALDGRDLAYTTVLTVLSRLQKKKVVRRDTTGRAHVYTAAASREEYTAELLHAVLDASGDRSAALVRFAGSVSAEEAAALRRALGDPATGPSSGREPAAGL